ncbi:MAG: ABC transporter permease [Planctomycetota bacterium]|nr:MAG: ABC transporter permease [Planctomycetota bacterium]
MLSCYLGWRYLTRRRAAWLALAAVILSVAVPIVVLGVMQGIVDATRNQVRAAESDLTLQPRGGRLGIVADSQALTAIRNHDGVAAVAPFISGVAFINSRGDGSRADARGNYFTAIDGVDWDADWAMGRLSKDLLHQRPVVELTAPPLAPDERGSGFITPAWRHHLVMAGLDLGLGLGATLPLPPQPRPLPGIVLGRELIYGEGGMAPWSPLRPGRVVSLIIPDGRGGTIGRVQAEISDTLAVGALEIDRFATLMPLPLAQRLTAMDGRHPDSPGVAEISGFRVVANQPNQILRLRDQLESQFPLYGLTWQERRGNLVRSLEVQRNILLLVMVLIQGICVFIIYAVFSTLVVEKRHDIGVLLGLGAAPHRIAGAFLFAGQSACIVGGMIGWALGWAGLWALNPLSELLGVPLFPQAIFYSPQAPISWDARLPALFIGVIMSVGLVASLLPAWRAARIDPISTLREHG